MNKTLIALAILALIVYYLYSKSETKPNLENNWIWEVKEDRPTPQNWEAKYSKKSKQLDEKQLENNKLSEKIEALEAKIQDLQKQLAQTDSLGESEEIEDLTSERDEAIRQKNEAEQEALSLSNKLKLKHQEVSRKEEEITRLKKEASQKEVALNKKITEKNGLITTLNKEVNQHKQKHTQQLKAINLLFDPQAKDYQQIDFEGLYSLLEKKASHE